MSMNDSTLIFGDGTFEEQVQELVNYIARDQVDEARAAVIRPFQESLLRTDPEEDKKRRTITLVLGAVKGLGSGTEREIEGFFNLLFAHVLFCFPEEQALAEQVTPLVHTIVSANGATNAKYRALSNLFNVLPRRSPLRLSVYQALLHLAASQDEIELLGINLIDVQRWLSEWDVSNEDKSALLKTIAKVLNEAGHPEASYEFMLAYLQSLPASSSSMHAAALDTIALALQTPAITDFDSLVVGDTLASVQGHPLVALLHIFVDGDYAHLHKWNNQHHAVLKDHHLEAPVLERKIRLLSLATLGAHHVGQDIKYHTIATTLHVPVHDVEVWVIDAIRAKLISGKLSQPTQTLHVTRATHRSLKKEDWVNLEGRLTGWKSELFGVLEVLGQARHNKSGASHRSRSMPESAIENDTSIQASA